MAMIDRKKIICLLFVFAFNGECSPDDVKQQAMVSYLKKTVFVQGKAEIIFLLDRSGSVGAANFEIERGFVESFLTHIVVDTDASRVAVISYSSTVVTHIDYLKEPKTKCFLSLDLQDVAYEDSGATNIAAAFEEAQKVFHNARPNINKVVILVGDGLATKGGDAAIPAAKLKDDGVQIFCFGIGRFLQTELERLATSSQHVYTCPEFTEFKLLARKIRGDPHESAWSDYTSKPSCDHLCNSPYKGDPNDPGCCDPEARCTCALKSGLHTCVCKPGYYGLSGLSGNCRACPRGTYKSKLEPSSSCTPCPEGSTTAEIGSTKLSDCYCKEGYNGDPSNGEECKLVSCPPLQSPANGFLLENCNNAYGSTCHFMCKDGYDLVDRSSDIRECQSNREWTGKTTACREVQCSSPIQPRNGIMDCDQKPFTVGKKCTFRCNAGYTREGSEVRECTSSKQWSGKQTKCISLACELPPRLLHGTLHICKDLEKPSYQQACIYTCNDGFDLVGPRSLTCNAKGKLVDERGEKRKPKCIDKKPPEIICPPPMTVETDKGKDTASVTWKVPLATDNSGFDPEIITSPPNIRPNQKFPIGHNQFQYTAIDHFNLKSHCTVYIEVVDKEKPDILKCPPDQEVSTNEEGMIVYWDEPEFKDNSKKPMARIHQNHWSGDYFAQGTRTVRYIAEDESRNRAICEFEVIVSRSRCKHYRPPYNGALACDDFGLGYMCQAYCEDGYDFESKPAEYYMCNTKARWETLFPNYAPIPWPDCSKVIIPGAVRKKVGFYYPGDCNDPRIQAYIKKIFLNHVTAKIKTAELCLSKGACSLDTIDVLCGLKTERRKRDMWQHAEKEQLELEFEITINADQEFNDTKELMRDFLEILKNIEWDFLEDENIATTVSPFKPVAEKEKDQIEPQAPIEEKTIIVCKTGSVLTEDQCVLCPAGTFYNEAQECVECPVGFYQESEGQFQCNKCPDGTSTEQSKANDETFCKAICAPGTYSMTGLETCLACPVGTYQHSEKMSICYDCPNGTTTENVAAISLEDCRDKCPPGTFSQNSLEPCEPCPFHNYQPLPGEMDCYECPEQLSTAEKGATEVKQCIDIDPCLHEDSCLNNGNCTRIGRHAECDCEQGFEGDHCEKDIDECISIPCLNGGHCANTEGSFQCRCMDGFSGELCEIEINECVSIPCQNYGTCIDKVNAYMCICSKEFEGKNCEIQRELCFRDVACLNGGVCIFGENDNSSFCTCEPGFAGIDCSQNLNDCENITCKNNGNCTDGINSFTCVCSMGYTGMLCETDINECENNLCHSGSTCKDLVGAYKCMCPPGWNGTYCENKMDSDFILMFPDSSATIANMATMTLNSPLTEATISLWVQTNDTERSGTPLSYAVASTKTIGADGIVVDNALTISDCSEIKIYVNNEELATDLQVADGQWHHLAFTWSSDKSGIWALYEDGKLKKEGKDLRPHETIHAGGSMIIGQEQDSLGGGFSPIETFTGNITRVNIWNSYFSKNNITRLCNMDDELPDKVLAWPDFLNGLKGDVHIIQNSRPIISRTN